jgi:sec-independent protein translocase protein TatA
MTTPALMMWTPGPLELVILLVVVMMLFGVGKLPEVGRSLGRSIREFKSAQSTVALEESEVEADELSRAGAEARSLR